MTNMLKPIPPETFLQDISFQYSRTFRFSGYIPLIPRNELFVDIVNDTIRQATGRY